MNIIKRSGLKPFLAALLCVVIVLSSINLSSAVIPKQEEGSPILLVDYYAEEKSLEVFDWMEIKDGLEIVFQNSSKESETIDLLIYVDLKGIKELQELKLSIDGNAIIDSMTIDLCDDAFNVLNNYATIDNVGKNATSVSVNGEDIVIQAENIGASCVKFTVTIRDWSAGIKHHFKVIAIGPEGPPPGEEEPPPPEEGEEERPNIFIFYNDKEVHLAFFNASFTEGELFIMFSNRTVTRDTIEISIIAELKAIERLTGFNASIDFGARIESVSIDFYDNDLNPIGNYKMEEFGLPVCSVSFDPYEAIGMAKDLNADFVGFKITIGSWSPGTTHTLRILPFFSEVLYYETDDAIYVDPSALNLPPEIRVWWQLYNDTWGGNWTYRDISWEFGPRANYNIYCYNTTSGNWYLVESRPQFVEPKTWIELNAPVKINITIPKLLFEEGTELGRINIHWDMRSVNISAWLSIEYDDYWDEWRTWSSIWNYSDPYGASTTGEFFTLNVDQTTISESADKYVITVVGQFNDLTPKGIYHVNLDIFNNESNYIGRSSFEWETGQTLYKEVAVGGPWSEVEVYYDKMSGGVWTAEILNAEYELIRSIGVNQTFIIRLNITGLSDEEFENASITVDLGALVTYVNRTGWHEEYRVYHGGWVYNETLGTYVWDPNATIITREWVFGTYLAEQWVDLHKEFNVTDYWWNETTQEYYPVTYTDWAFPRLVLFYNNANDTFSCFLAYEYRNYTLKVDEWGNQYVEKYKVWEIADIPPEFNFYEFINGTKTTETNKIILEFKGKFIGKPGQELRFDYWVFSSAGPIWPRDWGWVEENARQLVVEKPVVKIKIKDVAGESKASWCYATEPNDWFIVEAEVEGGTSIVRDVDGISIRLSTWDYYWSENETIWSNVEIITTINLRDGTVETIVYNETNKEVYEYGTYEIWNETTGRIEEVEGWHWEHYSFNQTSGEWVNQWLGWHSKDTVVDATYVNVNNFSAFFTEDGDYVIQVNMSFTEIATDRSYGFDVKLLNYTYGPDYTKPWGEQLVEDWVYSTVYTINNGTVEIFVPKPEKKDYVETSSGERYLLYKKPYIMIKGEKLPLKEIKYWNGYEYEYRLLSFTGDGYYYTLENGTKIYVYKGYFTYLYNATINATFLDDSTSQELNITTCMNSPWWDWQREAYYVFTVDGEVLWLEDWSDFGEPEKIGEVYLEFGGYFTLINKTTWVNLTKGWIDWDYIAQSHYILLENGTKIYVKYDYDYMYQYYFERNGKRYYIEWPTEYYIGEYNGISVIVPRWFIRPWYYTLIGEEKIELPYEGVHTEYGDEWLWRTEWECLQKPKSAGGAVPEEFYAIVNGSLYPILSHEDGQLYIIVDGREIDVTKGNATYTNVNGEDCWNIKPIGFKLLLGNLTEKGTYDRNNLIELHAMEYSSSTSTITLLDGTPLTVTRNVRVAFYNVTVNSTTYYTANPEPYEKWIWENNTCVYILYLINGSKLVLKNLNDFEFIGVVTLELGEYSEYIPDTFTWDKTGETYNTTIQTDKYGSICLAYWYYRVYTDTNVWYDLVPLDWYLQTDREWGVPPRPYGDDLVYSYGCDDYFYVEDMTIYNITVDGSEYTLYPNISFVKRVRLTWGHPVYWHLEEFKWGEIAYIRSVWDIIVGIPDWGLWGYRKWTIDPETGVIDLDGDLSTTDDQFYVKRVYIGANGWNETRQGLDVHIEYDPNPVIPGDELYFDAWMGIATNTYWNRWNETYYWYYTNMTPVSAETMAWINETLWDTERNAPKPGYWDIARMARNMTWEDYLEKARREGWDWVKEEVSWSWLWFGFQQHYWVSAGENETFKSYEVNLRYEYAGMFVYNDTNGNMIMDSGEESHYFIPEAIGNVTFITPGKAFGIDNKTGELTLPINESIEFGVSYLDINGTMFPFGRSYYAWFGEDVYGTDLKTFQERPVGASVEELSFKLHFYVENSTETNSTEAHIKIDQHIGNWNLDLPSGIVVLENLSLSLNYYIYAETSGTWEVVSEDGTPITPEKIVEVSRISLDTGGLKFAEVNMGDTYLWGGNLSLVCNVSTHTVPLSTFVETYTGYESETSVGGWTFQQQMYFLSVGFPKWDGYFVYEDPEVVVYSGKQKKTIVSSLAEFLAGWIPTIGRPEEEEEPPEKFPLMYIAIIVAVVAVGVAFVIIRKRKQAAIVESLAEPIKQ